MYRIEYGKDAFKTLAKMPKNARQRIISKITALAVDPDRASNVKKLSGCDSIYRLRVGDWRVVYLIDDEKLLVYIQKVGARGGIYR